MKGVFATNTGTAPFAISNITATTAVRDSKPADRRDTFPANAPEVHVWVELGPRKGRATLNALWNRVANGEAAPILEVESVIEQSKSSTYFTLTAPRGRPLPAGAYRVDLSANETLLGTANFSIGDELKIVDAKPARGYRDGQPVDPADVFTPDRGPIYVWFSYTGPSATTKLRGIWHYGPTPGSEKAFIESETTVSPGDGKGEFHVSMDAGKTWPVGVYRLDLVVGNDVLKSVPFRVAAPAQNAASAEKPSSTAPAPAGMAVEEIEKVLRDLGYNPERVKRSDNQQVLAFNVDKNRTLVVFYACASGICAQLQFRAGFASQRPVSYDVMNDWNRAQRFVTAYLDANGDPTVKMDLLMSGTQRATIEQWIDIWRRQLIAFLRHIARTN